MVIGYCTVHVITSNIQMKRHSSKTDLTVQQPAQWLGRQGGWCTAPQQQHKPAGQQQSAGCREWAAPAAGRGGLVSRCLSCQRLQCPPVRLPLARPRPGSGAPCRPGHHVDAGGGGEGGRRGVATDRQLAVKDDRRIAALRQWQHPGGVQKLCRCTRSASYTRQATRGGGGGGGGRGGAAYNACT